MSGTICKTLAAVSFPVIGELYNHIISVDPAHITGMLGRVDAERVPRAMYFAATVSDAGRAACRMRKQQMMGYTRNGMVKGGKMSEPPRFKVIDLFAGAGGLTLGFSEKLGSDFQPVWANDFNANAAETYNANFGNHCTHGDILALLADPCTEIPKADVVIGGPPCQGFSLLNKNRAGDIRKDMWRPFLEVVERADADVFLIENVPQLLGSPEHGAIIEHARKLGFETASAKLCAADYGVPQTRHRAFILGCRFADPHDVFPPEPTHHKPNEQNGTNGVLPLWRTVHDAISDLEPPVGTELCQTEPPYDLHFGRKPTTKSLERYQAIPEEGMNRFDLQRRAPQITPDCWIRKTSGGTDLFGRLWWDRPAFTIRTEFFKPEKGRYLHPCQHRPLTHREAARLQSFPDDFLFCGSKIEIAKQIGNAVPPLLAAAIARSVQKLLWRRWQIVKVLELGPTTSLLEREAVVCST